MALAKDCQGADHTPGKNQCRRRADQNSPDAREPELAGYRLTDHDRTNDECQYSQERSWLDAKASGHSSIARLVRAEPDGGCRVAAARTSDGQSWLRAVHHVRAADSIGTTRKEGVVGRATPTPTPTTAKVVNVTTSMTAGTSAGRTVRVRTSNLPCHDAPRLRAVARSILRRATITATTSPTTSA